MQGGCCASTWETAGNEGASADLKGEGGRGWGREAHLVLGIGIGALSDQQFSRIPLAIAGRQHQWSPSLHNSQKAGG